MPLPRNGITRMRGSRTVTRARPAQASAARSVSAQPLAGATQRNARIAVAAGRQHAVARIDGDQRFGAALGHFHRVERRHAVGAGRHRLAGFDALRRASSAAPARSRRHPACRRRQAPSRPAKPWPQLGRAGAVASAASARPAAAATSSVRGVTGFTSESTIASTSASGVSRVMVCIVSDAAAIFAVLDLVGFRIFSLPQRKRRI